MPLSQPIDRRQQPRASAHARGVVVAPGLEMACVIVDTSSGGLRIRTDRHSALSGRVTVVDVAAGLAMEVDVAWSQGMEAGLRLRSQASVRGLVPSRLLPAREAWLRAGGR